LKPFQLQATTHITRNRAYSPHPEKSSPLPKFQGSDAIKYGVFIPVQMKFVALFLASVQASKLWRLCAEWHNQKNSKFDYSCNSASPVVYLGSFEAIKYAISKNTIIGSIWLDFTEISDSGDFGYVRSSLIGPCPPGL
jgi:hypothetical protein